MLVIKYLMVATDFHWLPRPRSIVWLLKLFCWQQKNETRTGLEQHEGE